MRATGRVQSMRGTNYCKSTRLLKKRTDYLQQSTDEDSDVGNEMSDNDADMGIEVSASEFEEGNEDGNEVSNRGGYELPILQGNEGLLLLDKTVASGEMPNPPRLPRNPSSIFPGQNTRPSHLTPVEDRLASVRRLGDYFDRPLPHEQDLEIHRASIRQMLGEDNTADDDGDSVSNSYGYRKRSVAPAQIRYHEVIQKAQTTSRDKRTDIRADKDAHAKTDYREVAPINELQCQNIESALQATREAFFEYTGFEALITKRTESYAAQWSRIRSDFENFDWSEEPDGEAPYFPNLPAWHTSLENMPVHVKDTMYYEAWLRGYRTPMVRLPNGNAVDLPGEFLERIGRYPDEERAFLLDERYRAMWFRLRSNRVDCLEKSRSAIVVVWSNWLFHVSCEVFPPSKAPSLAAILVIISDIVHPTVFIYSV